VGDQLLIERSEANKVTDGSVAEVAESAPRSAQEQAQAAGAQRMLIQ
jgi:hypothetical protein